MEENTKFASELLAEVKAQSRRNFILFILMVLLEGLTIAWFTLPSTESSVNIDSGEGGNASYYESNEIGGDLNNGENSGHKEEKDKWKADKLQEGKQTQEN